MNMTRYPARFALLMIFVASCLPQVAGAQGVYKCVGPDGRTRFSDTPCEAGQKQDTLRADAGGGGADWRKACSGVTANDPAGRHGYCRLMQYCEQTGNPGDCDVFCFADVVRLFPGAGFGPTSAACLSRTKFKRGATWVQVGEISPAPDPSAPFASDLFRFRCVNARGKADLTRMRALACKTGTTSCVPNDFDMAQAPENPQPLEKVAADVCRRAAAAAKR
jgi:hypothetical protein